MFTGIVESLGKITNINLEEGNVDFTIKSSISKELKIDQSVSHNGVCLTVVDVKNDTHTVTAVKETLDKSSLKNFNEGDSMNLERAMKLGERLDGHMVQGHVDGVAKCIEVNLNEGSWIYKFEFDKNWQSLLIEKGSVCINGVSLTVFGINDNTFCVTIIPYTFENTSFKELKPGDLVNIEFDMVGKYLSRFYQLKNNN
ncbi:MAG: riboflavin synthase [Flavobacteriaceae bacterium]|nr:MAG: riboflavin synthase [Bacteroidota bacterium]|tara:strand:+ start:38 stop:634 length:597 start_codon:yes stop_codon:yes gene_type:complete